ncbi:hypothetical protein B9Z47_02080 [Limnohabitans sp. 2KL-1]|uniref:porin n=1 Tax=Limnohabitans sp. 2KL-1 TaxID=1100699 RepID=UPI000D383B4F|nr:porin [Limnohabitans sp. 2KL-1]PUE50565.1 hypothetical protein B9Z47_02080 [Limnohabitans sp. 2KL-1]
MKTSIYITAAIAALSAPAWAQSNVTIYGIADAAIASVSNIGGGSSTSMESGYLQSSRLGFRGKEDMGGGLSALFTLESGFNIATGANSSSVFFNRQSFMGLSSTTLGSITAGRQYTPIYDQLIFQAGAPAFGVSGGALDGIPSAGSSASRYDNTLGGTRIDNSIKYNSPRMGGWRFDVMYGYGGVNNSSSANSYKSVATGYKGGSIEFGMGYQARDCVAATGCTAVQARDEVVAIGGGYNFGAFKLASIYTSEKNGKNVKGNNADLYHAMVQVPVGAWFLSAGVQKLNDKAAANQDGTQYNFSALYSLSKATTLYGAYSQQKVINGGKAGMALVTSSDGKQNVLALGIRQVF